MMMVLFDALIAMEMLTVKDALKKHILKMIMN